MRDERRRVVVPPGAALTAEALELLQVVYERWLHSGGQWPTFAEVDKVLDKRDVDAIAAVKGIAPRLLRRGSSSTIPTAAEQWQLTVRGLAELPERPPITEQFAEAVKLLADRERAHSPSADSAAATVTSNDLALHLQGSSGAPRHADVTQAMSRAVGTLLLSEGHLWTRFSSDPDGMWSVEVARSIRAFRGVQDLADYLKRSEAQEPTGQALQPGSTEGRPLPSVLGRVSHVERA